MTKKHSGRLLVVDDEIETLTPLCDLLSEWGYEVYKTTSGEEALETIKKHDFDIILADLVMPEMDGIILIKEAVKIDPLAVCIIITGHGTIQTAVEAMKSGAFDYILKPIDWKIMRTILNRAIEVRRLKKSEKRYRTIIEDQTDLIFRWKHGEILTFVNEAFLQYFNKQSEELIGHSFMPFILEKDREKVRQHFASITQENPVLTHEHKVLCPDGSIRWQQWTTRAIFDSQGNIVEYQSIGRDITERKYRESEEKYRIHFENINDVICSLDTELRITNISPSVERILGYKPEELTGKPLQDLNILSPDSLPLAISDTKRILSGEKISASASVYKFIAKDGTIKFGEISSKPLFSDGKIVAIISVARDITERIQAENALRESELRFRSLVENTPVGIWQDDIEHRTIYVNPAMLKMLEVDSLEEIIGKKWYPFVNKKYHKKIELEFNKRLKGISSSYEVQLITKYGNRRSVIVNGAPMISPDGQLQGTIATFIDITERKKAEEEIKHSHELLRSLTARLSEVEEKEKKRLSQELHDLVGQNITTLGINIDIIQSLMTNPDEKILKRLIDSRKLLEETARTIRDVMSELRPSLLDDYGLIAAITWYSENFSERTGIKVKIRGKETVPRLSSFIETTLYRITQEALTNIAKHSKASNVTISYLKNEIIKLIISDNGIGFDPNSLYKTKGHTGWGIHTMKERAEGIGGRLKIESSPDKGTKIIIEIKRE